MKGLLYKERLSTRAFQILYFLIDLVLLLCYLIPLYFASDSPDDTYAGIYSAIFVLFCYFGFFPSLMIPVSQEIDEKSNFDKFILSAGAMRKNIVQSKMIFGLLSYLPSFLLFIVFLFCLGFSSTAMEIVNINMLVNFGLAFLSSTIFSVAFAVFLSLAIGSVKTRVVYPLVSIFTIGIGAGVVAVLMYTDISDQYRYLLSLLWFIIALALAIGLYYLSLKIYKKKEF